jgi:hypothetical protein
LFGSGGSASALDTLTNVQPINPITLANKTSVHPKAMKYRRRVMLFRVPELQRFLLLLPLQLASVDLESILQRFDAICDELCGACG